MSWNKKQPGDVFKRGVNWSLAGRRAAHSRGGSGGGVRHKTKHRISRNPSVRGKIFLKRGRVRCPNCDTSIRVYRVKRHVSAKQKAAFKRRFNAAKRAGWEPFTKMTKAQKAAFSSA